MAIFITNNLKDGEFMLTVTRIQLSPSGQLRSITVTPVGFSNEDNSQYLDPNIEVNSKAEISSSEPIPARYVPFLLQMFETIKKSINYDLTSLLIPEEPAKD